MNTVHICLFVAVFAVSFIENESFETSIKSAVKAVLVKSIIDFLMMIVQYA